MLDDVSSANQAAVFLTRSGIRQTSQRIRVVEELAREHNDVTAGELHDRLRRRGAHIGLATVYRTLQGLAQAAEVDMLRSADGEVVYRRCTSGEHHHHLVCRSCGRTVEVAGPAVERWAEKVAAEHGFAEVSHTLEVFGTCASCADRAASG